MMKNIDEYTVRRALKHSSIGIVPKFLLCKKRLQGHESCVFQFIQYLNNENQLLEMTNENREQKIRERKQKNKMKPKACTG